MCSSYTHTAFSLLIIFLWLCHSSQPLSRLNHKLFRAGCIKSECFKWGYIDGVQWIVLSLSIQGIHMGGTKWSSIVSVEIPKYGFLFLHKVAVKFCIPQTGTTDSGHWPLYTFHFIWFYKSASILLPVLIYIYIHGIWLPTFCSLWLSDGWWLFIQLNIYLLKEGQ